MKRITTENQYGESVTDNGDGTVTLSLYVSPETSAKFDAAMELVAEEVGRPVTFPEFIEHIANVFIAGSSIEDGACPDK
jgi:hypothetical protein